jgi:hypothetical protein
MFVQKCCLRICIERMWHCIHRSTQHFIILTAWSRTLLEHLIATHLCKKCYGAQLHVLCLQELTTGNCPESFKMRFDTIVPCILRSPKQSVPFKFSDQNIACISHCFSMSYLCSSSHLSWFHRSDISWRLQSLKFLITQRSTSASCFSSLQKEVSRTFGKNAWKSNLKAAVSL